MKAITLVVNENQNGNVQTMTSLEIAELTGKQHKNIMQAIRNMEPAWEKVTGLKFELSGYKDSTGRTSPCYVLTKTECLYIATKFNDEARARGQVGQIVSCLPCFLGDCCKDRNWCGEKREWWPYLLIINLVLSQKLRIFASHRNKEKGTQIERPNYNIKV